MLSQYRDVFASFERHGVEYLVIGGVAAALHGVPRATFDLDILIEATSANARRLLDALLEAGLGTAALTSPEDLLGHEITVFEDRLRIDVQTRTPGITFREAWARRRTMTFQGQDFQVACRDDLVASKRAAGRPIDLDDVRLLTDEGEKPV
jgi:hypothetical protein